MNSDNNVIAYKTDYKSILEQAKQMKEYATIRVENICDVLKIDYKNLEESDKIYLRTILLQVHLDGFMEALKRLNTNLHLNSDLNTKKE